MGYLSDNNIFSARMLNFISADDCINNHNFPTLHSQTSAPLPYPAQPSVLVSEKNKKGKYEKKPVYLIFFPERNKRNISFSETFRTSHVYI